jgi:hypothetical protein
MGSGCAHSQLYIGASMTHSGSNLIAMVGELERSAHHDRSLLDRNGDRVRPHVEIEPRRCLDMVEVAHSQIDCYAVIGARHAHDPEKKPQEGASR